MPQSLADELSSIPTSPNLGQSLERAHRFAREQSHKAVTLEHLLLAADIAVRIIPSTSDIKVGVLTSIIGVPFFLYLIMRERRALGGGVA